MYFRLLTVALPVGVSLAIAGCVQVLIGQSDLDAAKREATTIGTLVRVSHGRGDMYEYAYQANGISLRDYSSICKTPLKSSQCDEGTKVLVYYDRDNVTTTRLEELGVSGRERKSQGFWFAAVGLLVSLTTLLFRNASSNSIYSDDDNWKVPAGDVEDLRIAPANKSE